ncbi:toprim domain-containing protein [uncultured Roseovarius sp.]|uniref:toprim domain-containing protein n=1 Tax=uncultured Roseovarius sp. TaxID=293344 RepID=UPI0026307616|nr:toprim domain-containing protein [uncultured Roseovarius sp.]
MTDAAHLTRNLGGKWLRCYGTAPCPCCQPERRKGQNALTLAYGCDGRLLMNCKKRGCSFHDILAAAGVTPGSYTPPDPATIAQREREERAQAEKRARQARALWQEAEQIGGTIAETYLRNRGITCDLPIILRYKTECWHASGKRFPAMVALIEGADNCAIHRTYLRADGTGKAAVDPAKAILGAVAGGAVRLTKAQGPLVVAEGIETALSLASGLLGRPATIWAALSTSGMRGLRLPPSPGRLTIATDSDDGGAGHAAGRDLAERAHALGWAVSLLPAPNGRDWNDILTMKGEIV